jgi:hypothetical protein
LLVVDVFLAALDEPSLSFVDEEDEDVPAEAVSFCFFVLSGEPDSS